MKKHFQVILIMVVSLTTIVCCTKENTDVRDSFDATYLVSETWQENSVTRNKPAFTMSVLKSAQSPDKIILSNFANYGSGILAEAVVSGTIITIPQQTIANSKSISGSGRLENSSLIMTYTETSGGNSFVVTVNAKKL